MGIITRGDKGSALSYDEMDNNLNELDKIPNGKIYPNTKGVGIKISGDTSDFGWHDIVGTLYNVATDINSATYNTYRGGIRAFQFNEGDEAFVNFHLPHDYLPGSDIFIHAHWSHISTTVTGGTVTWGFETMYAKGHDQGAFQVPKLINSQQSGSTIQYQHMISETPCSVSGGGTLLDTDEIEVDGIIQIRLYLNSNDLETSDASTPNPFAHFVDIHYQSTGLATKNKAPNFWG